MLAKVRINCKKIAYFAANLVKETRKSKRIELK